MEILTAGPPLLLVFSLLLPERRQMTVPLSKEHRSGNLDSVLPLFL